MILNQANSTNKLLRRKNIAIFSFIIGILASVLFFKFGISSTATAKRSETANALPFEIRRIGGYKNIRPIISVEPKAEAQSLDESKTAITSLIDSLKQAGAVEEISVYLRNTSTSEWTSINDKIRYHPASLLKVPLMLAWLKVAEANPGVLQHKLDSKIDESKLPKSQYFKGPSIENGKDYSVHDLIFFMIAHSDNRAAYTLQRFSDMKYVSLLFNELELPEHKITDLDYMLTASEYSMFIKAIFNSSFNNPEYSQYASEMMENSSFKEGFAKGLPTGTRTWHKFGEWSLPGKPEELHQSGVIFMGNEPYILTIMTRGKNFDNLANIIAMVTKRVYAVTVKQT